MKKSEARIIMYLLNVSEDNKFISRISIKLRMDYAHTIHLIIGMAEQKWITKDKVRRKTYINLTSKAPVKEAKEILK